MTKKFYLLILFSILTTTVSFAQQSLDINFYGLGFLDNREYKDFVARSRTYSGTRTALDLGLNLDSLNHFIVGADAIHEFGAVPYFLKVNPIAYYKFESTKWLVNIGEFPRRGLISDYPRALLNDTLMYYRPNVEGIIIRFQDKHFMVNGWIDWVSRQTDVDREQFLFGTEGKYLPSLTGPFYARYYFMLEHDAGAAILLPNDHISDNGGAQIRLGLDFSKKQKLLDSLSFETGVMVSLERTRGEDALQTPTGFIASLYGSYHRFAAFDEFYDGQGSHINYGDSFYEKKFYNRLDLIYTPFLTKHIRGSFIFSIHRTPGYTSNQEVFRVTYDLGRKTLVRFKDDD